MSKRFETTDVDFLVGRTRVSITEGDITDQDTDAVVNAANSSLMGGGGVDGAIHRKGGPEILEECRQIRATKWLDGLPPGNAVITTGGRLKARYVIHTVGPIWRGGHDGEQELLSDCYRNSLALAKFKGLQSISFPAISTGAFRYPVSIASGTAVLTVKDFLEKEDGLSRVVFVVFNKEDLRIYNEAARRIFSR